MKGLCSSIPAGTCCHCAAQGRLGYGPALHGHGYRAYGTSHQMDCLPILTSESSAKLSDQTWTIVGGERGEG